MPFCRRAIKEHNLDTNKEFLAAKNEASVSALRSMLQSGRLSQRGPKKGKEGG